MPLFLYKAKKGPTEIVNGTLEADNEDMALGKIAERGLVAIKLSAVNELKPPPPEPEPQAAPESSSGPVEKKRTPSKNLTRLKISSKDLNIFTRQFAMILKAHVPILKIFEILQTQTSNVKFREVLQDIQSRLREGESIAAALGTYPRIFSEMFVNMVNTGEVSGTLDKVLMRLAEFAEKEADIRSRVQNAFIYPLFLLCVGIGTIFILLTFVMPRLMALFSDLGTQLPTPTRILIQISTFLQHYWLIIIGVVTMMVFLFQTRSISPGQKKALDKIALGLPVFGDLIKKAETAKFLRSVELLYESGIPLYQAVGTAAQTVSNFEIRDELLKLPRLLEGGKTFSASLEEVRYISKFVSQMISVGEESGQLGDSARETAGFYEHETNQAIKVATTLLEPLMILVIGIVIGGIVIAMLLPIFEIHVLAH